MERIRQDAVAWQEVEGEIVCLDLANSYYFSVNDTGTALFKLLMDGADPQSLATHLQTSFGISQERANADVSAFLQDLRERGLLEQA